jgi:hypothetical protein
MYSSRNSLCSGTKKFDISFQEATITPAEEDRRLHVVVSQREPGRPDLEADDGAGASPT